MPAIVVNHMLEPPGRVTGITRFLFAMLEGLVGACSNKLVLVTCWQKHELPPVLRDSRLTVVTVPFRRKLTANVMMQGPVLTRLMRQHAPAVEFNANPLGFVGGTWPRVITVHDLYLKLMPDAYPARHRITWSVLFPLSARRADAIVVPSNSTKHDLLAYHAVDPKKVCVIPEAPAFDAASPVVLPPIEGRYGLIVGNLSPNKNAGIAVAALKKLELEGLRIPMLHIGRDEHGLLEAAQQRYQLATPILTMPGISDGALRGAYSNATFFLNTSLHEGFCLPVVEAQVCGAPVIVSRYSALPEVAGDGALYIDPKSEIEIAEAIKSVWTNPAVAEDLSRRGHANVARFSWSNAARDLLDVIDTMRLKRPQFAAELAARDRARLTGRAN